jgi:hypothetical protein
VTSKLCGCYCQLVKQFYIATAATGATAAAAAAATAAATAATALTAATAAAAPAAATDYNFKQEDRKEGKKRKRTRPTCSRHLNARFSFTLIATSPR